jgi:hypothetical protein
MRAFQLHLHRDIDERERRGSHESHELCRGRCDERSG